MTITWTYEDALALMNPGEYIGVLREDADTVLRYMHQTTDILAKRCGGELSFNALCQMRIAEDDARELFKLNNKYPKSSHDLNQVMETMRSIQGMALAKIHQQVADEHVKLARFAREALRRAAFQGADLDGATAQELAVEHGLLQEVEVSEPCDSDYCTCAEVSSPPWTCYQFTEVLEEKPCA